MTGDPGGYQITFRFRGIVETNTYTGGVNEGTYWQIEGTPGSENVNYYRFSISDPPQDYFINRADSVEPTQVIDYEKVLTVNHGATLTLYANSLDGQETGNDTNLTVSDDQPGYPIVVGQPFSGQFAQVDAISIIPLPAPTTNFNPSNHASEWALTNGNATATLSSSPGGYRSAFGLGAKSTGKWQVQFYVASVGTSGGIGIGLPSISTSDAFALSPGGFANAWNGFLVKEGTVVSGGLGYVTGKYVNLYFDADAGNLWIEVNGIMAGGGNPFLGTSPTISGIPPGAYVPAVYGQTSGDSYVIQQPNYLLSSFSQWTSV
jgi:hypothetical protein